MVILLCRHRLLCCFCYERFEDIGILLLVFTQKKMNFKSEGCVFRFDLNYRKSSQVSKKTEGNFDCNYWERIVKTSLHKITLIKSPVFFVKVSIGA